MSFLEIAFIRQTPNRIPTVFPTPIAAMSSPTRGDI
jgi:hypothetical protein